jgi:HK97 family phage prohead protease
MEIVSDRHLLVSFADLNVRWDSPNDSTDPHFQGWACRNNVIDAYGTEFAPGSWDAGGLDAELYALCWMHDPTEPVGVFRANDQPEGLNIQGWWDDTAAGRDARTKARSRSAPELSVGFRQAIFDDDKPNRIIACKLVEVSQITARMAAVPGSELTDARSTSAPTALQVARARLRLRTVEYPYPREA